ncbi:MAG: response regulator [Lysobacterales bacterium]
MNSVKHPPDNPKPALGHILVAEDDIVSQMVVKKMLNEAGYTMDLVVDGLEVIKALESRHYDLILMDCLMPRMNGFDATRAVRSADSTRINPEIPVIAMTGLKDVVDQQRCLDAGMQSVINKPFNLQTLIPVIQQFLAGNANTESVSDHDEIQTQAIRDDGFLDSVIDEFLQQVPEVIGDLQQAVDRGDTVKLRNVAHRFRGATDILDASGLSARSRVLEQAAKNGNFQLAATYAAELIEELKKLSSLSRE